MDFELRLALALTRRLPRVRGAGAVPNLVGRFYVRERREWVDVDVLGFKMRLDPYENCDRALLFHAHLYDHYEIRFLKKHLRPGDVFVDLGANVGFYSLVASKLVAAQGRVLAIEADPYNHQKLLLNLELNGVRNAVTFNVGVADRRETLPLGINTTGNRGGSSFLSTSAYRVQVECWPLSAILEMARVDRISAAKIDIEGLEFRTLKQFFMDVGRALYPRFIIVERNPLWVPTAGGDPVDLLKRKGYTVHWSSKLNHIMELQRGC
jgi:FkbM family methyltransferase